MSIRRRTIVAAIATLPLAPLFGELNNPGARPLIVLFVVDPWLVVLGSDSPTFALYDDGQVIYQDASEYKTIGLTSTEKDELVNSPDLMALPEMSKRYEASEATDRPTQRLLLFTGKIPITLSVYGSLREAQTSAVVPPSLVRVCERLLSFRSVRAEKWLPDKVEVMIWPYEYAPEESIKWPEDWPGLDDPHTIRRKSILSIYLDSSQYPRLISFLATRREKGAIEIGGRKWAADVRFPFPHEASWTRPHEIDAE